MSDQVLGVINPAMAVIFTIGVLAMWQRDRRQSHLLAYAIGAIVMGASFTLNHYMSQTSPFVARLFVSGLSMSGCALVVWGACTRLRQPPPVWGWVAGALVTIAVCAFSDPVADIVPWLLALNIYCGIVFMTGAQTLSQARSRDLVDRAMVLVFLAIAVQFIVRPILVVMIEGSMTSGEYRGSVGHAMYMVSGAVFMVILAGSIIATTMVDQFRAISDRARIDALSGLALRQSFEERAAEMLMSARADDVPISVIVADIDNFKSVNDIWGHPAGDKAIATFGQVISRTIRPSDLAGRIGGEEFCVMVWNCPEDAAAGLANRLRKQFAQEEHEGMGPEIRLTASFGVAAAKPADGYERAYERADAALYKAKRAGRNRVVSETLGQIGHPEQNQPKPDTANGAEIVSLEERANKRH